MFDFIKRENRIFDILQRLSDQFPLVVVGGYAISAYKHRFSIDADIVIQKARKDQCEAILKENGFRKTQSKKLDASYSSEFVRFEHSQEKVFIDLLVEGVGVRQTGAFFRFDFLMDHSRERKITGIEKEINVLVPCREVLIIMKLHSGRLTDLRDVAALAYDLDMELVRKHLFQGGRSVLRKQMSTLAFLIGQQDFIDSFKGVFQEKKYTINLNEIRKLTQLRE